MNINKIKSQKGQTILEMVIAAGIIVSSVVTVIALGIVTIRGGRESEYRVVAANLAREGIEYYRNKRDTNWLNNRTWNTGIALGAYTIEFNGSVWQEHLKDNGGGYQTYNLSGCTTCLLKLGSNGTYNLTSPIDSSFYRLVTIIPSLPDNITIKSQVLWKIKGKDYKVTLEENLTQWR